MSVILSLKELLNVSSDWMDVKNKNMGGGGGPNSSASASISTNVGTGQHSGGNVPNDF